MALPDGTKLTLHWLNGSRAQGTLWLLEELGVPYELKTYQRQAGTIFSPAELEKIHPMGKSPTITITRPGSQPIVLAESGFIAQYLSDHFSAGKTIVPKRWKDGQEGQIGGETEGWMRYAYILYYSEASLMATIYLYIILNGLRPVTESVANEHIQLFVVPNLKKHFTLLEGYLSTAHNGGKYICGENLTAADMMLGYALTTAKAVGMVEEAKGDQNSFREAFPKLNAYIDMLEEEPSYKKSVQKIVDTTGSFTTLP